MDQSTPLLLTVADLDRLLISVDSRPAQDYLLDVRNGERGDHPPTPRQG